MIIGQATFLTPTSAGERRLALEVNGVIIIANINAPGAAGIVSITNLEAVATFYQLNAGDFVRLVAFQNSGAPGTITASPQFSPEFMMFLAAPAP